MDASAAGPVGVDYRGVLEVINGLESSNLEERKLVCLAAVHWEGRINSDFKGAVDGFAYNLLRKFVFEAREGRAHDFYGCNSRRAIEAAYPGSRKAKKDYKKKRDVNALCLDLFVRYLQKYRRAEVPAELHGLRCVQAYMNVYVEG
ncbi:hypothetical protein K0U07_06080, partial [bacterium]|nr:hypothetical protein [bacterium]